MVLAALLLSSLFAIIYSAWRALKRPPPKADGAELFTVIVASGDAENLERMVQGLLWLNESGEMKNRVVIADCGLETDAKKLACLLAKADGRVTVCAPGDLPMIVVEESGWTLRESI